MSLKYVIITCLLSAAVGGGLSYYYAPAKTVVKTEVVEKQINTKDVVTLIKEVKGADGTTTTVTEIVDKSVEKRAERSTATTETGVRKDWLFGVGSSYDFKTVQASVHKRVLGPVFVGVTGIAKDQKFEGALISIAIEF